MKTLIVNIPEKEETFFLSLLKKFQYKSRALSQDDKEDSALLSLMYKREDDENIPVSSSYKILDKIIKK